MFSNVEFQLFHYFFVLQFLPLILLWRILLRRMQLKMRSTYLSAEHNWKALVEGTGTEKEFRKKKLKLLLDHLLCCSFFDITEKSIFCTFFSSPLNFKNWVKFWDIFFVRSKKSLFYFLIFWKRVKSNLNVTCQL